MSYPAPNYTQCPNLLIDEHLPDMGHAECKVVLAITRQTFGWHKRKDRLSISQLMELTGLSNRAVIDGVRAAMERGVLDREREGQGYIYWLVVGREDTSQAGSEGVSEVHRGREDTSQEGVSEVHRGCEDTSQEAVSELHIQKKEKETLQKKEKENSRAQKKEEDPVRMIVDLFECRLNFVQKEKIRATVEDMDRWRSVIEELALKGHTHRVAVSWALDNYEKKGRKGRTIGPEDYSDDFYIDNHQKRY